VQKHRIAPLKNLRIRDPRVAAKKRVLVME
jgi:hypothetical protein